MRDLLGIEVPVICAPFGPWEEVGLAAAVCEAGGLGSLGTAVRSVDELREQWSALRVPAGEIVRRMAEEAEAVLTRLAPAAR
ncbi:hypothetical protein G5C60_24685 [Streptomyces sp. HC44]|uniref:Uncharacterized protein n=1 Tax=Streptomyces scabichelini TaxID=2711217 RepID=A0A6G4V9Y0_9ACTN|nr:nitronate monooxygenase [Streptomyces scabichelini]NGO10705.1 hypothetical protein [Streptomyces scabichelini]